MIKMFHLRVGDPDDPADRERLEAQSPFFHAESIEAPLLVIQGSNDPRVKKAESDQIVVRLRDLGRDVEYLLAGDEGHGFQGVENQLAMWAAIEAFLAPRLGGRAQSMEPEVAAKVAALRVDVKTLEMPPEAGATVRPKPRR
jgi:dipeptidyl aminopeptidase/acylaminoacyl peptidase